MTAYLPPRFINWTVDQAGRKYPCDARGNAIDPHDPQNWRTYAEAVATGRPGWVLNGDGWFFLDLDKCHDGTNWTAEATAIFHAFPDALREVSQSNAGLHIIGRCDPSRLTDRKNRWDGWCEFYTDKRFVALNTITSADACAAADYTDTLLHIVPQREFLGEMPDGRDPSYTGPEDDDELIAMMLRSTSATTAFGGGVTIRDLWEANAEPLGRKYPDPERAFDASAADSALMSHLAFWTGKGMPRMDRLFRRSALMRDKYERREDYRRDTIQNAARLTQRVYYRAVRNKTDLENCHADMSHDDLAREIYAKRWAGNMLYIPEYDRWAEWNGKRWRLARTRTEQITRLRQDLRDVPGADDATKRKRLGKHQTIMAINFLMKTNEGATRHQGQWDENQFLLGTPTQIVDLRTGEVRPRVETDYLLCSTQFDPEPAETTPRRWLEFLRTVTGDDSELQEFLQRLSGYAATGSTKEHKLFFAYGTGRNGKSTWLNTLEAILSADYAKVIPPKLLLDKKTEQHATDLAHLAHARLARASELPVGKVWDEALLKQITGGDQITARYMRQDNFSFRPQCTLIVDANNAPSIRGIDEAFWRRMCVIPFETTISRDQVDPDLPGKLLKEGPAILRWMIEGAVKWHENGLSKPIRISAATDDYLEQEDTFGAFLDDHFDREPSGYVSNSEIHFLFQGHMGNLGLPAWSPTTIGKEMLKRGFSRYKSGSIRGFRGLRSKKPTPAVVKN